MNTKIDVNFKGMMKRIFYYPKNSKMVGTMKGFSGYAPSMLNPFKDTDKDGVINLLDCQPRNPKRDGIKMNREMMKRLQRLPIYVTDKPAVLGEKRVRKSSVTHVTAKKPASKKAQIRFYSTIKKYPSLVGDIERTKPRSVLITTAPHYEYSASGKTQYTTHGEQMDKHIIVRMPDIPYNIRRHKDTKEEYKKRYGKDLPKKHTWGRGTRTDSAETAYHELKHVKQLNYPREKYKKMEKGRYERQEIEKEADRYAKRKISEEERRPREKTISKRISGFFKRNEKNGGE